MPDFSHVPSKDGYAPIMPARSSSSEQLERRPERRNSTGRGMKSRLQEAEEAPLPQTITGQVTKTLMNGDEALGIEFDIPEDAYGAALCGLVRDFTAATLTSQPREMRRISAQRAVTAVLTMIFNLLLQCGILYYIHTYIVQPSLRTAQIQYARFTTEAYLNDGTFNADVWESFDGKQDLCGVAMTNKPFFMIVLTLWTLTMVGEYRSSSRFARNISAVPDVSTLEEQLDFGSDGIAGEGECLVLGLTKSMRVAVYVFVLIPKYIILLILLVEGSRWLATAVSFGDIILNSVALGFVIGVDEILYSTLLPLRQQQQVASTNFFVAQKPYNIRDVINDQKGQFNRSALYAVIVLGWVVFFIWGLQDVLPFDLSKLEGMCQDYLKATTTPVCTKLSAMRWNEECYPKGVKPQ